jgi:hypothetical protein
MGARLTRPRKAPATSADHPSPQTTAVDPAALAGDRAPSRAQPRNRSAPALIASGATRRYMSTSMTLTHPLTTQPYMDDIERLMRCIGSTGLSCGIVARVDLACCCASRSVS